MPVLRPDQLNDSHPVRRVTGARLVAVLGLVLLGWLSSDCRIGTTGAPEAPVLVGIIDTGITDSARAATLDLMVDRDTSRSLVPGEDLTDLDGHGTEMAWIVHLAAPEARLAVVKVMDRHGATSDQRIAAALEHLRDRGASVVLVSLAGAEPLPLTQAAIERIGDEGVLVVTAAGNDGRDLRRTPSYPGGYEAPNLLTVAAVDPTGRLLGSSNRGGPTDVAAPGLVSTCGLDGRPMTSTGTSAAAALVAGRAASGADPFTARSDEPAAMQPSSPLVCSD